MYISRKKLDDSSIIRICQFRGYVRLNRSRVYVHSFLDINIISGSVSLSFVFVFFFFYYIWKEKVMEFVYTLLQLAVSLEAVKSWKK